MRGLVYMNSDRLKSAVLVLDTPTGKAPTLTVVVPVELAERLDEIVAPRVAGTTLRTAPVDAVAAEAAERTIGVGVAAATEQGRKIATTSVYQRVVCCFTIVTGVIITTAVLFSHTSPLTITRQSPAGGTGFFSSLPCV